MIGYEIETCTGAELLRFVRALGQHRYVASRLHLVHAFALESVTDPAVADAAGWAKRCLGASGAIDLASKDERLYRRASDAEVLAVLATFWGDGPETAKTRLRERLTSIGCAPNLMAIPFDESGEEDVFPMLIDAGWELVPLAALDSERHRGAIQAFDDFEVARFEEENHVPPLVTLHELPLLGGLELLGGLDEASRTRAPFVLWQEGHETYLDYVRSGVLRAAKITATDD